ncbi:MOSC domain-containing protein [Macrococcus armenti]|uniref:MOSC domain-containing protein n=1 Tax=Macrococcus armenti TaxID=2875764 RepID=UPI001CCFBDB2|nr:MOSC domain-containing protein [Macrococcus armenti]UBH15079.1 MOSC domain-containing protein [Macrococcus armenti]UBH17440.1 MOSC domain-containing protein [Macrococcus armenti]UBH19704.1 MOSC domain-containing protein [Macrococcus armenti]
MKVQSMFIGKPKQLGDANAMDKMQQAWVSAINRDRVDSGFVDILGFNGDEVADKKHHGGVDKAVFCYPYAHYEPWRNELNIDIDAGGFGENLCVTGMDESTVHLGDIFEIGSARLQVTQPRKPCWKPARKYGELELSRKTEENGRTGWYFKVLVPGDIHMDDEVRLVERMHYAWSIARCNDVMHRSDDMNEVKEMSELPELAETWKVSLQKKLEGHIEDSSPRIYGPNV